MLQDIVMEEFGHYPSQVRIQNNVQSCTHRRFAR
jgi:hypothetical protein